MAEVALDIGNTRVKAGRFESDKLVESQILNRTEDVMTWLGEIAELDKIVVGSVADASDIVHTIEQKYEVYKAKTSWKHPLDIRYESLDTLGIDRLAAVVGAWQKFLDAIIVFDIGSCMTIDYVDEKGVYHGGNISPGWDMRLKAMHKFTAKLPMGIRRAKDQLFAKDTEEALQLGAYNGLLFEIEQYIKKAKQRNSRIHVVLTGGGAYQFAKHLKIEIFVLPNIILEGLHKLLHANL